MAFWDNWFKVECSECRRKFAKDELVPWEDRMVCEEDHEKLEVKREQQQREIEERRMAEERARAALLDRPIQTSGAPFAVGRNDDGDHRF